MWAAWTPPALVPATWIRRVSILRVPPGDPAGHGAAGNRLAVEGRHGTPRWATTPPTTGPKGAKRDLMSASERCRCIDDPSSAGAARALGYGCRRREDVDDLGRLDPGRDRKGCHPRGERRGHGSAVEDRVALRPIRPDSRSSRRRRVVGRGSWPRVEPYGMLLTRMGSSRALITGSRSGGPGAV